MEPNGVGREPNVGDYVLATKFSDGDPGDRWAVGYLLEKRGDGFIIGDSDGKVYGWYGYARAGLAEVTGAWLVENSKVLESSPPGSVNLWGMMGATAFEQVGRFADTVAAGSKA